MRCILKYKLSNLTEQRIQMPKGAQILAVHLQKDHPTIWIICDNKDSEMEERIIHRFGTGKPIPENLILVHLGTISNWTDKSYVGHFFEEVGKVK